MASADHIVDSLESVSLHIHAIELLADTVSGCIEDGGTRKHQYEFCLAFRLLAEAAQAQLHPVHNAVADLIALKRDMDALARAAS